MPQLSGCVLAKCVAMQHVAMQCVGPYVMGDNRLERLFNREQCSQERSIFRIAESFHRCKVLQIGNFTLV